MERRVKRWILIPLVLCISLLTISSCEEDSEVFENVKIEKKETTNDSEKKAKPGE